LATKVFTFQARALDGLTNESGALTYVVRKGTTTPIIAYTDSGLTTPATNPQVANSLGLVGPLYWNERRGRGDIPGQDERCGDRAASG